MEKNFMVWFEAKPVRKEKRPSYYKYWCILKTSAGSTTGTINSGARVARYLSICKSANDNIQMDSCPCFTIRSPSSFHASDGIVEFSFEVEGLIIHLQADSLACADSWRGPIRAALEAQSPVQIYVSSAIRKAKITKAVSLSLDVSSSSLGSSLFRNHSRASSASPASQPMPSRERSPSPLGAADGADGGSASAPAKKERKRSFFSPFLLNTTTPPTSSIHVDPKRLKIPVPVSLQAIMKCLDYLEKHHISEEGLFLMSGEPNHIVELMGFLDKCMEPLFQSYSPHTIATVAKLYLTQLSDPLLSFQTFHILVKPLEDKVERERDPEREREKEREKLKEKERENNNKGTIAELRTSRSPARSMDATVSTEQVTVEAEFLSAHLNRCLTRDYMKVLRKLLKMVRKVSKTEARRNFRKVAKHLARSQSPAPQLTLSVNYDSLSVAFASALLWEPASERIQDSDMKLQRRKDRIIEIVQLLFERVEYKALGIDNRLDVVGLLSSNLVYTNQNLLNCLCYACEGNTLKKLADLLMPLFGYRRSLKRLFSSCILAELNTKLSTNTLFRNETLSVKLLSIYLAHVAGPYLSETLRPAIQAMEKDVQTMPIDSCTEAIIESLASSLSTMPPYLRNVCIFIYRFIEAFLASSPISLSLPSSLSVSSVPLLGVCSLLFLRLISPTLISPDRFQIIKDKPSPELRAKLTQVAKQVQSVANDVTSNKVGHTPSPLVEKLRTFLLDWLTSETSTDILEYEYDNDRVKDTEDEIFISYDLFDCLLEDYPILSASIEKNSRYYGPDIAPSMVSALSFLDKLTGQNSAGTSLDETNVDTTTENGVSYFSLPCVETQNFVWPVRLENEEKQLNSAFDAEAKLLRQSAETNLIDSKVTVRSQIQNNNNRTNAAQLANPPVLLDQEKQGGGIQRPNETVYPVGVTAKPTFRTTRSKSEVEDIIKSLEIDPTAPVQGNAPHKTSVTDKITSQVAEIPEDENEIISSDTEDSQNAKVIFNGSGEVKSSVSTPVFTALSSEGHRMSSLSVAFAQVDLTSDSDRPESSHSEANNGCFRDSFSTDSRASSMSSASPSSLRNSRTYDSEISSTHSSPNIVRPDLGMNRNAQRFHLSKQFRDDTMRAVADPFSSPSVEEGISIRGSAMTPAERVAELDQLKQRSSSVEERKRFFERNSHHDIPIMNPTMRHSSRDFGSEHIQGSSSSSFASLSARQPMASSEEPKMSRRISELEEDVKGLTEGMADKVKQLHRTRTNAAREVDLLKSVHQMELRRIEKEHNIALATLRNDYETRIRKLESSSSESTDVNDGERRSVETLQMELDELAKQNANVVEEASKAKEQYNMALLCMQQLANAMDIPWTTMSDTKDHILSQLNSIRSRSTSYAYVTRRSQADMPPSRRQTDTDGPVFPLSSRSLRGSDASTVTSLSRASTQTIPTPLARNDARLPVSLPEQTGVWLSIEELTLLGLSQLISDVQSNVIKTKKQTTLVALKTLHMLFMRVSPEQRIRKELKTAAQSDVIREEDLAQVVIKVRQRFTGTLSSPTVVQKVRNMEV